ncbi:MAG: hypothetical protein AAB492_01675 [Patescibacteria group bacterium]
MTDDNVNPTSNTTIPVEPPPEPIVPNEKEGVSSPATEFVNQILSTPPAIKEPPLIPYQTPKNGKPKNKYPIGIIIGLILFLGIGATGTYFITKQGNLADKRGFARELDCRDEGCSRGYSCKKRGTSYGCIATGITAAPTNTTNTTNNPQDNAINTPTPTPNLCGGRAYICRWQNESYFNTVTSNKAANYISCNGDKPNPGSISGDDGRCGRPVAQDNSCNGLVRSSNGEANHGGFVGCQGKKNCFCGGSNNSTPVGGTYSGGTIQCFDDYANDSCGKDTTVVSGNPTATPGDNPNDTPTPTTPNTPICTNIKVYKNAVQVAPSTLLPEDTVTIAVVGTGNPTQARFRVNGAQIAGDTDTDPNWTTTTTKNASLEYFVSYTIPTGVTTFLFEGETFAAGAWH